MLQVRPRRRQAGQVLRGGRQARAPEAGADGEAGPPEQGQRCDGQHTGSLPKLVGNTNNEDGV